MFFQLTSRESGRERGRERKTSSERDTSIGASHTGMDPGAGDGTCALDRESNPHGPWADALTTEQPARASPCLSVWEAQRRHSPRTSEGHADTLYLLWGACYLKPPLSLPPPSWFTKCFLGEKAGVLEPAQTSSPDNPQAVERPSRARHEAAPRRPPSHAGVSGWHGCRVEELKMLAGSGEFYFIYFIFKICFY